MKKFSLCLYCTGWQDFDCKLFISLVRGYLLKEASQICHSLTDDTAFRTIGPPRETVGYPGFHSNFFNSFTLSTDNAFCSEPDKNKERLLDTVYAYYIILPCSSAKCKKLPTTDVSFDSYGQRTSVLVLCLKEILNAQKSLLKLSLIFYK